MLISIILTGGLAPKTQSISRRRGIRPEGTKSWQATEKPESYARHRAGELVGNRKTSQQIKGDE